MRPRAPSHQHSRHSGLRRSSQLQSLLFGFSLPLAFGLDKRIERSSVARPEKARHRRRASPQFPVVAFSGTMDGRLHAFSTRDGTLICECDTAREFTTVNGVNANGGSMSNAGPAVVGGRLFMNSGYSHHGAVSRRTCRLPSRWSRNEGLSSAFQMASRTKPLLMFLTGSLAGVLAPNRFIG